MRLDRSGSCDAEVYCGAEKNSNIVTEVALSFRGPSNHPRVDALLLWIIHRVQAISPFFILRPYGLISVLLHT